MRIFTYAEDISYINDKLSAPAILGQAAEEADEFGKACLKLQRILIGENPTPVIEPEARASLIEEIADVFCCIDEPDWMKFLDAVRAERTKRGEQLYKSWREK